MLGLGSLALLASLNALALASPVPQLTNSHSLADLALQKVLEDASPIFGAYEREKTASKSSTWMRRYHDSTKLVHMNIPGTHDAATWNYSAATQDSLKHITDLNNVIPSPPEVYRCQENSMLDMLNAGIRAFDFRFAADATNTSLVFYHSKALQSETATVQAVLFAFSHWLDGHPSEALLLSLQYEGGTKQHASSDAVVQTLLHGILTSAHAQKYIVQAKGELGTLGQARGKITLLRRFTLDRLPAAYDASLPGLRFLPDAWTDNGKDIELVYNTAKNLTAYIEDFYEPDSPAGSGAELNIQLKYNATVDHIRKATTRAPDSLFWTWASGANVDDVPIETPRIMALGNGTESTPRGGVNQRLVPFFQGLKGKRVGIVMFDFFDQPGNLIDTFLHI